MVVGMGRKSHGVRDLAGNLGGKEASSVSEHTIVVSTLEYLTKRNPSKVTQKILKSTVSKRPVVITPA